MQTESPAYGLWWLVALNSAISIMFAVPRFTRVFGGMPAPR